MTRAAAYRLKIDVTRREPMFEFDGERHVTPRDVRLSCTICGDDTWLVQHRNWTGSSLEGSRADVCYFCAHKRGRCMPGICIGENVSFRDYRHLMAYDQILKAIIREAKDAR